MCVIAYFGDHAEIVKHLRRARLLSTVRNSMPRRARLQAG